RWTRRRRELRPAPGARGIAGIRAHAQPRVAPAVARSAANTFLTGPRRVRGAGRDSVLQRSVLFASAGISRRCPPLPRPRRCLPSNSRRDRLITCDPGNGLARRSHPATISAACWRGALGTVCLSVLLLARGTLGQSDVVADTGRHSRRTDQWIVRLSIDRF